MPKLLLVRHGITKYNSERRFLGYSDIDLSDLGRRQVELLRDYLVDVQIDAVYSSDLKRTMTTARVVTEGRDLDIVECPELREMSYGLCEGMTFGEINSNYPDVAAKCVAFNTDVEFPGGESFEGFISRTNIFLDRLKDCNQSDTVLVTSHSGAVKALICHLIGMDMKHWWQLSLDNASLSIVTISTHGTILNRLNDVSHLKTLKE